MFLNLPQIADSLGVPEKTIEKWVRLEGLPHIPECGRMVFDRNQVAHWAAARGLAAQVGFLGAGDASRSGLLPLLLAGGIHREVAPSDFPALLESRIAALPGLGDSAAALLTRRMSLPAGLSLAPVGGGLAFPHPSARLALGKGAGLLALVLLREAYAIAQTPDGIPVRRLFFFMAPSARAHLDIMARLGRIAQAGTLAARLDEGASDMDIRRFFENDDVAILHAGEGP